MSEKMTNVDALKEILTLSKESAEHNARMETQLSYMEKRIAQMEALTAKMSQTLNEQKQIQFTLNALAEKITDNTARIEYLENKFDVFEDKSGSIALKAWKKIGIGIFGAGISVFAAFLVTQIAKILKM